MEPAFPIGEGPERRGCLIVHRHELDERERERSPIFRRPRNTLDRSLAHLGGCTGCTTEPDQDDSENEVDQGCGSESKSIVHVVSNARDFQFRSDTLTTHFTHLLPLDRPPTLPRDPVLAPEVEQRPAVGARGDALDRADHEGVVALGVATRDAAGE